MWAASLILMCSGTVVIDGEAVTVFAPWSYGIPRHVVPFNRLELRSSTAADAAGANNTTTLSIVTNHDLDIGAVITWPVNDDIRFDNNYQISTFGQYTIDNPVSSFRRIVFQ